MGATEGESPSTPDEIPAETPAKGKIVATWLVKVTQRLPVVTDTADPVDISTPTIDELTESVAAAAEADFGGDFNATAERTDI
jgi:hypothetical protein